MLKADSDDSSVPCNRIRQLADIAPVYYSFGNHENIYISDGHLDFINQLKESGADMLDKFFVSIEVEVFPIRLGDLYNGDQEWFPKYVHGLYKKDNFQMFMTSGLGSNKQKLPRFNNSSEIATLDIEI